MVRYKVHINDTNGNNVAIFDDWRGLTLRRNINGPDAIQFVIGGTDSRKDLFEIDGQIIVYRKFGEEDYKIETGGFLRGYQLQQLSNGNIQYAAYARGWEDLLIRRIVAYYAGTINTSKDGPAETVMKEFVLENAGSEATVANGRLVDGVISQLSIESDGAGGDNWSGARAYRNLLEVIQEVSATSGLDFWVEKDGDRSWVFKTGSIGANKTNSNVDSSTGKNEYGYIPVIFEAGQASVQNISYTKSHIEEVNTVLVLGQGEGALRTVVVREDNDAQDASFINRREVSRNGSSQSYVYQLEDFGDDWLRQLSVDPEFSFDVMQIPSQHYGEHYTVGDYVTARLGDIEAHKRIVAADISVGQQKKEVIKMTYKDFV